MQAENYVKRGNIQLTRPHQEKRGWYKKSTSWSGIKRVLGGAGPKLNQKRIKKHRMCKGAYRKKKIKRGGLNSQLDAGRAQKEINPDYW